MTLREKMKKLCGVDDLTDFETAYKAIIDAIGMDKVEKLIPVPKDELLNKYKEDEHFNNTPMRHWDIAAGFNVYVEPKTKREEIEILSYAPLPHFIKELGVDSLSCSQGVCILKIAAKIICEEQLRSVT